MQIAAPTPRTWPTIFRALPPTLKLVAAIVPLMQELRGRQALTTGQIAARLDAGRDDVIHACRLMVSIGWVVEGKSEDGYTLAWQPTERLPLLEPEDSAGAELDLVQAVIRWGAR